MTVLSVLVHLGIVRRLGHEGERCGEESKRLGPQCVGVLKAKSAWETVDMPAQGGHTKGS